MKRILKTASTKFSVEVWICYYIKAYLPFLRSSFNISVFFFNLYIFLNRGIQLGYRTAWQLF